jgi:hypothetical protein
MVDFYWALWFGLRKEVVLGSLTLAISIIHAEDNYDIPWMHSEILF